MEENISKIYVKTDISGNITAINSFDFISDVTDWTLIDEGTGDKYHHAQNNYLDKPLTDANGIYNYKLVDGRIIERTKEDKAPNLALANASREIAELKTKLVETDYIAAKIAEGSSTVEEYSEEIRKRREWRARINELELI